jgi:hypothetical protein
MAVAGQRAIGWPLQRRHKPHKALLHPAGTRLACLNRHQPDRKRSRKTGFSETTPMGFLTLQSVRKARCPRCPRPHRLQISFWTDDHTDRLDAHTTSNDYSVV